MDILESSWTTRQSTDTPFSSVVTFKRFFLIHQYSHIKNDVSNSTDYLVKIRVLLEHLTSKFHEMYTPFEDVGIDENVLKHDGRLPFGQLNPVKAHFGIKYHQLCK
jgi:hypothetical protein